MSTLASLGADWSVTFILIATLNLIVGKTGIWSVGHVGFYALGQMVAGYLVISGVCGMDVAFFAAIAVAGLLSGLIGAATLRLQSDYFIILSIAAAIFVQALAVSLVGPSGASGLPHLFLGRGLPDSDWLQLGLTLVPAAGVVALCINTVSRGPVNRVLAVVRQNDRIAESMGIPSAKLRLLVFMLGSVAASGCGVLAAAFYGFTDPATSTLYRGILLFALMLFGGVDSLRGSALGALVLASVPRILEYVFQTPMASYYAAQLSQLLFALLMLFTLKWLPAGLTGRKYWGQ
jgi:branched-chain amino acid transport system permease protein